MARPADEINRLTDLNARNLYAGWYYGAADDAGADLDEHHAANPGVPLGLSEYGADARPEYHSASPEPGTTPRNTRPSCTRRTGGSSMNAPGSGRPSCGTCSTSRPLIRDEGGTKGFNMKGLVTRYRAVRKDAFWWYKANWSDQPVLHMCSKRFVNRDDPDVEVKVYANVGPVELTVDGESVGGTPGGWSNPALEDPADPGREPCSSQLRRTPGFSCLPAGRRPDPSYACPDPRRSAGGGGTVVSWFANSGMEVDHSHFGTWSSTGR